MARKTKTGDDVAIIGGQLFIEDTVQCSLSDDVFKDLIEDPTIKSIRLVSLQTGWEQKVWLDWDTSIIEKIKIEMTLRKEIRSGAVHWYAYRRVFYKLHKRYVGVSSVISEKRLLEVARNMPG